MFSSGPLQASSVAYKKGLIYVIYYDEADLFLQTYI